MPSSLLALAGALALLAATPVVAQQLYRWVDAQGVTHYSDSPPEGVKYETRQLRRSGAVSAEAEPAAVDPDREAVLAAAAASRPADPQRPAKCRQARENLDLLDGDQPVAMDLDDDGVAEPLDAAAREEQRQAARRQVAVFCD